MSMSLAGNTIPRINWYSTSRSIAKKSLRRWNGWITTKCSSLSAVMRWKPCALKQKNSDKKLDTAHAELAHSKIEIQVVMSENVEYNKVEVPTSVTKIACLKLVLELSGNTLYSLNQKLKFVRKKYRELSVKYTSLRELIIIQGIQNVRKFLELCVVVWNG